MRHYPIFRARTGTGENLSSKDIIMDQKSRNSINKNIKYHTLYHVHLVFPDGSAAIPELSRVGIKQWASKINRYGFSQGIKIKDGAPVFCDRTMETLYSSDVAKTIQIISRQLRHIYPKGERPRVIARVFSKTKRK